MELGKGGSALKAEGSATDDEAGEEADDDGEADAAARAVEWPVEAERPCPEARGWGDADPDRETLHR